MVDATPDLVLCAGCGNVIVHPEHLWLEDADGEFRRWTPGVTIDALEGAQRAWHAACLIDTHDFDVEIVELRVTIDAPPPNGRTPEARQIVNRYTAANADDAREHALADFRQAYGSDPVPPMTVRVSDVAHDEASVLWVDGDTHAAP
jgi:hypothetical protein